MQTGECLQHAPDHLQSQTVKLRKLIEKQRVHCPGEGGDDRLTCQLKSVRTSFTQMQKCQFNVRFN